LCSIKGPWSGLWELAIIENTWDSLASDSQPGCRGTLGCREKVPGVPPTFECAIIALSQT